MIGDGLGSITSDPAGIACWSTCSLSENTPTTYVLTATPDLGSELVGWTGCDAVDGFDCTVTMENDYVTVTTNFDPLFFEALPEPVRMLHTRVGVGGCLVVRVRWRSRVVRRWWSCRWLVVWCRLRALLVLR